MGQRLRIADTALLGWVALATILGLFFIFDAGYARQIAKESSAITPDFWNQLKALPLGIAAFWVFSNVRPETWEKWSKGIWIVSLISLLLVYVPGIGKPMNGANRWIQLIPGLPAVQPAEFVKVAVIIYLAGLFAQREAWKPKPSKDVFDWIDRNLKNRLMRFLPAVWVLAAVILIEKEPDLGTAFIVAGIAWFVIANGGVKWPTFWLCTALGVLVIGWLVTHETYRMDRINNHLHRWDSANNMDEMGYQTVQSELGMAQGGLVGVGIGGGRAKHVMPACTTDFMLATIGEEFGFIGSFLSIGVLGMITLRLLKLAKKCSSPFGVLVLSGAAAWVGVQTVVNVVMANGFFPAIGVPLPFLSYGGSSLMALWMVLGVCNSVLLKHPVREATSETRGNRRRHGRPRLSRA
jgi:cell division protein FtsW